LVAGAKGKGGGGGGGKADAAGGAEEALGVEPLAARRQHGGRPVPQAQRSPENLLEGRRGGVEVARHHEVDVVLAIAIEEPEPCQRDHGPVDACLAEAQLAGALDDLLVVALPAADDRRQEREALVAQLPAHAVEDLAPG